MHARRRTSIISLCQLRHLLRDWRRDGANLAAPLAHNRQVAMMRAAPHRSVCGLRSARTSVPGRNHSLSHSSISTPHLPFCGLHLPASLQWTHTHATWQSALVQAQRCPATNIRSPPSPHEPAAFICATGSTAKSLRHRPNSFTTCHSVSQLAAASPAADDGAAGSEPPPHVPVLLQEVLGFFADRPLQVFVDGTLGAGGHSCALAAHHPVRAPTCAVAALQMRDCSARWPVRLSACDTRHVVEVCNLAAPCSNRRCGVGRASPAMSVHKMSVGCTKLCPSYRLGELQHPESICLPSRRVICARWRVHPPRPRPMEPS